jgi:hypothetical protein
MLVKMDYLRLGDGGMLIGNHPARSAAELDITWVIRDLMVKTHARSRDRHENGYRLDKDYFLR